MTRLRCAAAAAILLAPAAAGAHAVVYPKVSTAGAYERYVLRVPNEKGSATTRIEIRFPDAARVISFADVPGWQVAPVLDSAQRIIGAAWTGTLPPQRFVELPFIAVNPKTPTQLVWPVFQTYADGERIAWTGAPDAKAPASTTDVGTAGPAPFGGRGPMLAALTALALSLIALGLSLRPSRPTPPRGAHA
jgi:uncharacterized protein YcnI